MVHEPGCMKLSAWDVPGSCDCGADTPLPGEQERGSYKIRKCRNHWHVTIGDYDVITKHLRSEEDALAECARINAEYWAISSVPKAPE